MSDKNEVVNNKTSHGFLRKDGGKTNSNAIEIPSIALPKGGGAIKGIDEKFSVNAVNGTCSFSIPLPVSPSRGGFQPALSLSYNSGTGNGIFGLGWGIDLPSIQRKTDKGLPSYRENNESDVFLFSGVEDLVPVLKSDGSMEEVSAGNFTIRSYRPRIEGLFARIERIIPLNNKNKSYWKVTTRENVVTFFGLSSDCRITDPANDQRIFKWLPELSFDDKGNCMCFIYKQEDKKNIIPSLHEQYRLKGTAPFTNNYLKRIQYGNKTPFYPAYVEYPGDINSLYGKASNLPTEFMFELVFDYGEHPEDLAEESKGWKARSDAFSDYKAGFEIRTYRLCERVMMFHHFVELNFGKKTLARSLDLKYEHPTNPGQPVEVTYLAEIHQKGFTLKADSYYSESLPLLSFDYQRLQWDTTIRQIAKEDLTHAPVGANGNYQWTDLYNEGVPGILTEQANAWYYKSNMGGSHFSNAHLVSPKPSFSGLSFGDIQLMELEADGTKQIVSFLPEMPGYFELTDDNDWLPFREFDQIPNIDLKDPNTRMVDLNGDGKADILVTEESVLRWYPSKGTAGYDIHEYVSKDQDEEKGPAVVFADSTQSIYLADMSGDGLTDIVRIKSSGAVCYWPNLGYGHFGAKVNMGTIDIADPFSFNASYLKLADVSGTGTTDIIYLGNNKWQVWINQNGNAFSVPCEIDPFWQTAKPSQIDVVDLLGNGTGCIVWSSPLPGHANSPMQYIDLMGGKKPHIMRRYKNGLGKINTVEYKSSSRFYLEDKKEGKRWITKLPFPVHCVSKVIVRDEVTDLRFTTEYSYHHGYFDHAEREFRGFGRVDQVDTEEYEFLESSGASNATSIQFHEPPVLTRTWYHTGAFTRNKKILKQFETEYWYNDPSFAGVQLGEYQLPEAIIPVGMSSIEYREACRSCKGMVLRSEVFALDKSAKEKIPYKVATHNCHIRMLQGKARNLHSVFLVQESESITFSYERDIADPRIAHNLNLEIDDYGNILKSISVVYGRNPVKADLAINDLEIIKKFTDPVKKEKHQQFIKDAQIKQHIIFTETRVTTDGIEKINGREVQYYRLPQPWSVKTFEASDIPIPGKYFTINDFSAILSGNTENKAYHEKFDPLPARIQLRLIEEVKTLFLSYDLETPLEAGKHGALGMPYESYQLAYTLELLDLLFNTDHQGILVTPKRVTNAEMEEGGYCHLDFDLLDKNWWIRSGKVQYFDTGSNETRATAQGRYFAPVSYTDPLGSIIRVEYPANKYFLFIEKIKDALDNTMAIVDFDYRVLAPKKMLDFNDNLSEVSINALGLVVGTAVMGKGNQADHLTDFVADLEKAEVDSFFNDPFSNGKALLKNATARMVYDFTSIPVKVGMIARETHVLNENGMPNPESGLQYSFEYTGGLGNTVLKKVRAEKGIAIKLETGNVIEVTADPRWVGNGRTIVNNKGKPVKQYEPYFSTTHQYEAEPALRECGVTPILYYDSAGRMVRTDYPDGTHSRVEFNSWHQKTFDQNDTIRESKWAALRGYINNQVITNEESIAFLEKQQAFGGDIIKEKEALEKSLIHSDTPTLVLMDALGRHFYSIDHNKWQFKNPVNPQPPALEEFSAIRVVLDIEGNIGAVIDGRDNTVMKNDFDMLGHGAHQISMDAGKRWLLTNIVGKPLRTWDERHHEFQYLYDILHRPVFSVVKGGDVSGFTLNHVFDRIFYGENYPDDKEKNLRGNPIRHFDTGGLIETSEYDFKGQPKSTTRRLFKKYKEVANWTDSNLQSDLQNDAFTFITEIDVFGRITKQIAPDESVITPSYNEAGLLNGETVTHSNPDLTKTYIKDISYNEKGQRNKIIYGNEVTTRFYYDKETFRLKRLETKNQNNDPLQDLYYTYDPVGNITQIEDRNVPATFFNNKKVTGVSEYTYDALYRLTKATGRENNTTLIFNDEDNWNDAAFMQQINPPDSMAVQNYTQHYQYDEVGNILQMRQSEGNTWTRNYKYEKTSNRLETTQIGTTIYNYTPHLQHGFMKQMPHLEEMEWNFKEELIKTIRQKLNAGNGTAETTYYQYDGQGQRIRKITENSAQAGAVPTKKEERIYISGFELYKKHTGTHIGLERTSLSLMDEGHRFVMIETRNDIDDGSDKRVIRYQLHNHIGSAVLELDTNAQVINYEEYHPFGTTAYQLKNKNIRSAAKRYRYTGVERDEETGFEYHSARYYLPWLGRWVSADPIGISDGVNVFQYSKNNPIRFIDTKGKQTVGVLYGIAESKTREADEISGLLGRMAHNPEQYPSVTEAHKTEMRKQMNSLYQQAGKSEQRANIETDFHRNVGLPFVVNVGTMVVAAPAGVAIAGTRVGVALTYYGLAQGTLGVGETIAGKTISLTPGSHFGEVKDLKGDDRFWHGVESASTVILSVGANMKQSSKFGSKKSELTKSRMKMSVPKERARLEKEVTGLAEKLDKKIGSIGEDKVIPKSNEGLVLRDSTIERGGLNRNTIEELVGLENPKKPTNKETESLAKGAKEILDLVSKEVGDIAIKGLSKARDLRETLSRIKEIDARLKEIPSNTNSPSNRWGKFY